MAEGAVCVGKSTQRRRKAQRERAEEEDSEENEKEGEDEEEEEERKEEEELEEKAELRGNNLTPYQHRRNILRNTCVVCGINNPPSNNGLTVGKKRASTTTITLDIVPVCREHNRLTVIFLGGWG